MLICSTTTKDNELTTRDVIGVISIIRNYIQYLLKTESLDNAILEL